MLNLGLHGRKALSGSAWLIAERASTLLLNFIVAIFVARHLEPGGFGALSYAIAFIALLSSISYLGFGGVVVQELVRDREQEGEIIGTVIGTKIVTAVLAMILANLLAAMIVEQPGVRMLILIISISMLFDTAAGMRLFFEARTDLKGVALVGTMAGLIAAAARASAVVAEAPLWVFAALVTLQSATAAIGYLWWTRRRTDRPRLSFRFARARQLLRKSWPLIISQVTAMIYLKIDQFMIGQMLGMAAVGTYAVAARLSEVWYFIPSAVAAAIFPRLVKLRASDPSRYESRIKEILRYLFWLSLAIAVPVSLAAPSLVVAIFGEPYREAGLILAIHVWACPAVFMGRAIEKWFVAEDLLKLLIVRQVLAALMNVVLNLLLIPRYGGAGAAVATLLSYTFAYYLSCFTSRRTAVAGRWMTEAMFRPFSERNRPA